MASVGRAPLRHRPPPVPPAQDALAAWLASIRAERERARAETRHFAEVKRDLCLQQARSGTLAASHRQEPHLVGGASPRRRRRPRPTPFKTDAQLRRVHALDRNPAPPSQPSIEVVPGIPPLRRLPSRDFETPPPRPPANLQPKPSPTKSVRTADESLGLPDPPLAAPSSARSLPALSSPRRRVPRPATREAERDARAYDALVNTVLFSYPSPMRVL